MLDYPEKTERDNETKLVAKQLPVALQEERAGAHFFEN